MNNRCPHRSPRRGFSLVELLVVVAIIALLVAITLPSLRGAKNKSESAVCGTRLRGLTIAFATYLAEWDNSVPMNGLIMPKSGIPTMYDPTQTQGCDLRFSKTEAPKNAQWRLEFGALWPYMGGPSMPLGCTLANAALNPPLNPPPATSSSMAKRFVCPADSPIFSRTYVGNGANATTPLYQAFPTPGGPPTIMQGVGSPGYWSYSVNSVLNSLGRFRNRFNAGELPWSDPIKMLNVKAPTDFITFIEEDNNSLFNDEVFDAPAYSDGDMLAGRHSGNGNVGFGDGHVDVFSQTIFNQVPSAISGTYVEHTEAMTSEITRKFFPDRGAFATP
jgi:prepilin-type N-terminal cleavage/methylation domain-containing protein/prepilin-type processing-associated H-X9-DG protein